mgnify:CR=1 FL=1
MDELYQAIEEKIKAAGYPREIPVRLFTKISVIRLKEKKIGSYVLLSSLRMM